MGVGVGVGDGVGLGDGDADGDGVADAVAAGVEDAAGPEGAGVGVEPEGKLVGPPLGTGEGDGAGVGAATFSVAGVIELAPAACAPIVTAPSSAPLYEMPTVEPGTVMVVACNRKAPLVSEFVIVIGTEY